MAKASAEIEKYIGAFQCAAEFQSSASATSLFVSNSGSSQSILLDDGRDLQTAEVLKSTTGRSFLPPSPRGEPAGGSGKIKFVFVCHVVVLGRTRGTNLIGGFSALPPTSTKPSGFGGSSSLIMPTYRLSSSHLH